MNESALPQCGLKDFNQIMWFAGRQPGHQLQEFLNKTVLEMGQLCHEEPENGKTRIFSDSSQYLKVRASSHYRTVRLAELLWCSHYTRFLVICRCLVITVHILQNTISLISSYSYSSENMSLKLLHRALIMRRVLTEPGKKTLNR